VTTPTALKATAAIYQDIEIEPEQAIKYVLKPELGYQCSGPNRTNTNIGRE
jgi:hypothetical protein